MQNLAHQAYSGISKRTASDRQLEHALFRQITEALETAAQKGPQDFHIWTEAVHRNTELWTLLAADVASPENQLPDGLKASLLSIARFVTQHSFAVMSGKGDINDLIEINRNLIGATQAVGAREIQEEAA